VTLGHGRAAAAGDILIVAVLAVMAAGYVVLVARRRARGRQWSHWRTASLLAGVGLLAAAMLPPVADHAGHSFHGHMVQHLLIGMYAPLGLVLAAPITLLLGSLPARQARRLARLVRSRPVGLLANPITALLLTIGGLAARSKTGRLARADKTFLGHIMFYRERGEVSPWQPSSSLKIIRR